MSDPMGRNGLRRHEVKTVVQRVNGTKVDSFSNLYEQYRGKIGENGYFYAYFDHTMREGSWPQIGVLLKEEPVTFLCELRIFDEMGELYLYRDENGLFSGRFREDSERVDSGDEGVTVIEAVQALREKKTGVLVRGYVGYNPAGQASYIDARFVKRCEVR